MKNPEIEYIKKNKTSFEKKVEKYRFRLSQVIVVAMAIYYIIDSFKYATKELVWEHSNASYLVPAFLVSAIVDIVISIWMQARENELAREYRMQKK